MQTILGASGQIGEELARALKEGFTSDIQLVSRNPKKINASDKVFSADLMNADQTTAAVAGSEVVYLTAGLPMDTERWETQWPVMMSNVIEACATHGARLVFFDNTYMYPQTSSPQTECTSFEPYGAKGKVRARIASQLLNAMEERKIEAMICRAPEFYGPGKTQSITNSTIIGNVKKDKPARVFLRDDTLRTLIYTPDASRAMAQLGNTSDSWGQTWHLPCDDDRLTYRQFIGLAADVFGTAGEYKVVKGWQLKLAGQFNKTIRDAAELLPRYRTDNIFVSDKFKTRFPDFRITRYRDGLQAICDEALERR